MSTGINRGVLASVTRVRATFRCPDGSELVQSGTGFWIRLDADRLALATCRHILDEEMTGHTGCKFWKVEILLREQEAGWYSKDTTWKDVIDSI